MGNKEIVATASWRLTQQPSMDSKVDYNLMGRPILRIAPNVKAGLRSNQDDGNPFRRNNE